MWLTIIEIILLIFGVVILYFIFFHFDKYIEKCWDAEIKKIKLENFNKKFTEKSLIQVLKERKNDG